MAIIKCKMCGGDLDLIKDASTAQCEYCGIVQTVPKADDEKKLTLFARADRFRGACEFDKAAGIYESIVADSPEESEAYWGLVLCKFGIEYVDDPATGKKVPTCHRSGFDSVLKDEDFVQALENADLAARRVLREEAEQIDLLRSNIISVSSKEEPYDVFICYKETGPDNRRTLDSVLAQDIYQALTDKGYRVFFARITLEDKLGAEYEPYIFAALNSAKVMLVVGTSYENFNAVWVKNEWSRYLKLMDKDKEKRLIPCYQNVDAHDMPQEFARLQGQDLSKLGAMQDLLRGVEKSFPKNQNATEQERIIIGGSVESQIGSLMDMGNMALEDGEWGKADRFFEDVLRLDSKNAQAFVGRALARERCRSMDDLICKRRTIRQRCRPTRLQLPQTQEWVQEFVARYAVPGYLDARELRRLINLNRTYLSELPGRQKNYDDEVAYWEKHQWLPRAEQFATGDLAEQLAAQKAGFMSDLAELVRQAEQAHRQALEAVTQEYNQNLENAKQQAQSLYDAACKRRAQDYQTYRKAVEDSKRIDALRRAKVWLAAQGDYLDCPALLEACQSKLAAMDTEKKRLESQKKDIDWILVVGLPLLVVLIGGGMVLAQGMLGLLSESEQYIVHGFIGLVFYAGSGFVGCGIAMWALFTNPQKKMGMIATISAVVVCSLGAGAFGLIMIVVLGMGNIQYALTFGAIHAAYAVSLVAVLLKRLRSR